MKRNLPRISLITPSYNQAKFIEKTINSVLSQKYPNLEYIVMDGGSDDGTVEILKKYNEKIIWYSRKDKGQTDAINAGIKKSTGEMIGYLNSDDILFPKALHNVANFFQQNSNCYWVTGRCQIINEQDNIVRSFITSYKNFWLKYARNYTSLTIINYISQPATFWRREVVESIGFFDQSLFYAMDYDYWLRISKIYRLGFIDDYLAAFRIQKKAKSYLDSNSLLEEGYYVAKRYSQFPFPFFHKIHDLFTMITYQIFKK
jgi:glycosyltransferase involved in cell wall biosynthesis